MAYKMTIKTERLVQSKTYVNYRVQDRGLTRWLTNSQYKLKDSFKVKRM